MRIYSIISWYDTGVAKRFNINNYAMPWNKLSISKEVTKQSFCGEIQGHVSFDSATNKLIGAKNCKENAVLVHLGLLNIKDEPDEIKYNFDSCVEIIAASRCPSVWNIQYLVKMPVGSSVRIVFKDQMYSLLIRCISTKKVEITKELPTQMLGGYKIGDYVKFESFNRKIVFGRVVDFVRISTLGNYKDGVQFESVNGDRMATTITNPNLRLCTTDEIQEFAPTYFDIKIGKPVVAKINTVNPTKLITGKLQSIEEPNPGHNSRIAEIRTENGRIEYCDLSYVYPA